MVYRLHVSVEARAELATQEYDDLGDGCSEVGHIVWIDYRQTADLPLFPPIGPHLAALPSPDAPVGEFELPPITDADYTWI